MNLFKSKQEKEIERKIKARQGKKSVERHVQRQRGKMKTYWELGKRAYRLKDVQAFEKIASFILATQKDITVWERRLLDFDVIEAKRDQVLAVAEFAEAYQEMAKSMLASTNPANLAKIQKDIDMALTRAEMMDAVLDNLMDISEDILDDVKLDDGSNEFKEIMAALQTEADAESQAPSDTELEASLRAIEDQLRRT